MTKQTHEKLIYNGLETSTPTFPNIPLDSEYIIKIEDDLLIKEIRENHLPRIIFSTACWRRYIGTWGIVNSKLYLKELKGRFKKVCNKPLFAKWYSGTLRVPMGEPVEKSCFLHSYEKELHIQIVKGHVFHLSIEKDTLSWLK